MPPVTLHQPVEGLDRGDTYSGPNEDWLVAEGYATRAKGGDGLHATSGSAKNDQRLAENREAPADGPPQPKSEVQVVDGDPGAYKRPAAPDQLDSTQPRQKEIDAKLKEVADGKRDPNAPDVVLADAQKAVAESRAYDGSPDEKVVKAQQAREKVEADRAEKLATERTKEGVAAAQAEAKAQGLEGDHVAPRERVLREEQGVGTVAEVQSLGKDGKYGKSEDAKEIGDKPRGPLLLADLPSLDPKDSATPKVSDVTEAPSKPRTTTVDTGKPEDDTK